MALDETLRKYRVPLCCPQCDFLMYGKSSETFFRWGVCIMCTIEFIEDREDRWKSGWRPSPEELEKYKKSRA